jgi:[acyl-carrier-protein] S-malonyltransferase
MTGIAFVFPGQGTQRLGMGSGVWDLSARAARLYRRAGEVLGFDVIDLCRQGPPQRLLATENAQPAVFVTNCAYAAAVEERLGPPLAVAGHSVGELSALVSAGALDFDDGVRLVRARGELMAAAPAGTMAAVRGLSRDRVEALTAAVSTPRRPVVVAVVNGPVELVIAGCASAVDAVSVVAGRLAGCSVQALRVSGAFHSPLMAGVVGPWRSLVDEVELHVPDRPVAMNAPGRIVGDVPTLRGALVDQLTFPVAWDSCVRALLAVGAHGAVECGDSRILRHLNADLGLPTSAFRSAREVASLGSGATDAPGPAGPSGAARSGARAAPVEVA